MTNGETKESTIQKIIKSSLSYLEILTSVLSFRWYPLQCKPGQNKTDYRGELEVRIEFKVNAR